MATKEIKTRIALRTGDYAYWTTGAGKDIELYKGEVCICTVAQADNQATNAPTVLFKVANANGQKFADLNWVSGLAADVYTWAKENALFIHKEGTGNVVSGVEWDASLNNGKGGVKYTTAAVATAEGLDELQKDVAAIEKDIADNRDAWGKYEDTRYTFSTNGDKLVVKKTLYTNGVAGAEEAVGTYEFLTAEEVAKTLEGYYTKTDLEGKIHTEDEIKAMEIAHATAAGKVDTAITVKVGGEDVVFDGSEAKTADVDAAIAAAIDAIPDPVDYTITCADTDHEATEDAPAFKRHTLTQNGKQVCVIDVPRDLVIKSGSVDKEKNELVLVLVNDEEIRVDVSHLIEYVTGGTAADGIITVNVDDNFVATATINDGTITEAKLHADVTAKLNKVWDAEGAAATAKEEAIAAAAKDAGDKAAVVLGEAQKYADEKVAALAGQGNTTTVAALAGRVNSLETAGYLTEVEADTGLKVIAGTNGANNKVAIDETVVFVLDCNW